MLVFYCLTVISVQKTVYKHMQFIFLFYLTPIRQVWLELRSRALQWRVDEMRYKERPRLFPSSAAAAAAAR